MIEIFPTKKTLEQEIAKINNKNTILSLWCEFYADLETPVSAYHKVCKDKKYSFLLESVEKGENFGRYSFIGTDPLFLLKSDNQESIAINTQQNEIIIKETNPYTLIETFMQQYSCHEFDIPYNTGLVGYLSYDTIRYIEPILESYYKKIEECTTFPESYFMIPGTILAFDHLKHKIFIIKNILATQHSNINDIYTHTQENINLIIDKLTSSHNLQPLNIENKKVDIDITSNLSKSEWVNAINKAKEHIKAGDIFQVVPSQRFCLEKKNADPLTIYRALRSINPSPYLYFLNFDDFQIVGSSPEIMVRASKDRTANVRPIAGTMPRGKTADEDLKFQEQMLNDPKEVAEHIMLVDLGRNDLGRVCEYGSVKVKELMKVEKYSHVQHIVSDVTGKLRNDISTIGLIKASFPAGTLSGAPKVRAMQIIYELEKSARGPYGGCIGYIGFNSEVNLAITIRTMLIKNDKIFVQAGAGIVADSDPDKEYEETKNKAAALIQAVARLK